MMLSISTTKFLIAELAVADYNFRRWTSKPIEYYSVNKTQTRKPPELHTIMKECNGTGLVLKMCGMKNNEGFLPLFKNEIPGFSLEVIIPGISEPPARTLRATVPENERHIFR